jgi:hypothetical protein
MKLQFPFLFLFYLSSLIIPQPCFSQNVIDTRGRINPEQIVEHAGFPVFGKWMLNEHFEPANWLRHKFKNKIMHEPINIILIDSISKSPEEAIKRLMNGCRVSGFLSRTGHSTKYIGYIGGNFYSQMPKGGGKALSDARYNNNNNHGRIFGPHLYLGKYYFTASLSREDYVKKTHVYDSFMKARDDFAQMMNKYSDYRITGKLDMKNMIPASDPVLTSGDHDGMAIILAAK